MYINKKYLEILFLTLKDTVLSLKEARVRDAFMKKVGEALDRFYAERKSIYEKFCTKNDDGTPKVDNNQYTFPPETLDELSKELSDLLEEEVDIQYDWGVTGSVLHSIIENTSYTPKVGETKLIDDILAKCETPNTESSERAVQK